jgi:hypothetical protein
MNGDHLQIMSVRDVPGVDGKSFFSGYAISILVDKRWIQYNAGKEVLQARLLSRNSVLLKYPKYPITFSLIHPSDYHAFNRGLPAYLQDGFDHTRHTYAEDSENTATASNLKHLVVDFDDSDDIELSSKVVFDGAGELEELKLHLKQETNDLFWVTWTVARMDISAVKKGKLLSDMVPKMSAAEAMLDQILGASAGGMAAV